MVETGPGPLPSFFIPRPDLVAELRGAAESPLSLVVAPGGSGKSLLLADWMAHYDDAPLAWLPIDARDNDGCRLARRLVAGLNTIDPDFGSLALDSSDRSGTCLGELFISQVLADLELATSGVLVIDELENLTAPEVLRDLFTLMDHAPPTLRTVVATRVEPDHRWHRPLSHVLGSAELAFDHDQAARLLEHVSGREVSSDQVAAVLGRTEGWPAGVQLFGLVLRSGGDADELIAAFNGAESLIGDYLIEEVFHRQPEEIRQFLLETSVLRWLSPGLCRAVTREPGAAHLLQEVERRSLFLVPMTDQGEDTSWFRYGHLFRERIHSEFVVRRPEDEAGLLRAAADWHLGQGDLAAAMGYLIDARDWIRVLDLLTDRTRSLFERGDGSLVLQWFRCIPDPVRRTRPEALLIEATLLTMTGATVEAEDVVAAFSESGSPTPGEHALVNALRASWVEHHISAEQAIAAADVVLNILETFPDIRYPDPLDLTSPDSLRAIATISRARARWYRGDVGRARAEFQAVTETSDEYAPWLINALGSLALVELWSGRLAAANQAAARSLVLASRHDLHGHPSTTEALLAMASLNRERNHLGRAELFLDQALALATGLQRWVDIGIHAVERAALDLALAHPHRGLERLVDFAAAGGPTPHPIIAAHLIVAEARLHLAVGALPAARRLLRTADDVPLSRTHALEVRLCVIEGDLEGARRLLGEWDHKDLGSQIDFELWSAVVADSDGADQSALQHLGTAVELAEPEGCVRLFGEAGPRALSLLARLQAERPSPHLERVLASAASRPVGAAGNGQIGLSPRELAVLRYLPGRFTNAELADELFISRNTVKSHLHRIYQQLGVTGRKEAVVQAERLGLL